MTSQPPYPPPHPPTQPIPQPYGPGASGPGSAPDNGMGTASLVVGVLAFLGAFVPLVGVLAIPLAVVGLVLGGLGLARVSSGRADNKAQTIVGIVLSVLALLVGGVNAWLIVVAIDRIDEVVDDGIGAGASDSSPDGTGLAVPGWEVVDKITPKRDTVGDFAASFRVENVGADRDSGIFTVRVLRDGDEVGSLHCTTPEVRPGGVATAACVSSSPYRGGWTEIVLQNTF